MSKFFRVGNSVVNLDRVITIECGDNPEVSGARQNYRFRTVLGHHDLQATPEELAKLISGGKS